MSKTNIVILASLVALVCLFFFWIGFGKQGLLEFYQMSHERDKARQEIEQLRRENAELERTIIRLRQDPRYVEGVARKDLKMVSPDEVIFQFNKASREVASKPSEKP